MMPFTSGQNVGATAAAANVDALSAAAKTGYVSLPAYLELDATKLYGLKYAPLPSCEVRAVPGSRVVAVGIAPGDLNLFPFASGSKAIVDGVDPVNQATSGDGSALTVFPFYHAGGSGGDFTLRRSRIDGAKWSAGWVHDHGNGLGELTDVWIGGGFAGSGIASWSKGFSGKRLHETRVTVDGVGASNLHHGRYLHPNVSYQSTDCGYGSAFGYAIQFYSETSIPKTLTPGYCLLVRPKVYGGNQGVRTNPNDYAIADQPNSGKTRLVDPDFGGMTVGPQGRGTCIHDVGRFEIVGQAIWPTTAGWRIQRDSA